MLEQCQRKQKRKNTPSILPVGHVVDFQVRQETVAIQKEFFRLFIFRIFYCAGRMSVSAGTTRIMAMTAGNNLSFDMDQRDPNNLNHHLQVLNGNHIQEKYRINNKLIIFSF